MGITIHRFITPNSFLMGIVWFSVFVLLGFVLRVWRFPIKYTVVPLIAVLIASFARMILIFEFPGSRIILSETIYPAVITFLRFELISRSIFGMSVNVGSVLIIAWIAGAAVLITRYIMIFNENRYDLYALAHSPRDEAAEKLMEDMVGYNENVRVFRTPHRDNPNTAAGLLPYIFLPEGVDFTPEELSVILKHEWKHCLDKDYLSRIVTDIICFIFWWNPLAHLLRNNVLFTQELKCEYFAIETDEDYIHYILGLYRVADTLNHDEQEKQPNLLSRVNIFDESRVRTSLLRTRKKQYSQFKAAVTSVCFTALMGALFIASYLVVIQAAFWESPDIATNTEAFSWDNPKPDDFIYFRTEEIFIMDNEDGTFSLYVEGQFANFVSETNPLFQFTPIRKRTGD